jgi:hypothetical protein
MRTLSRPKKNHRTEGTVVTEVCDSPFTIWSSPFPARGSALRALCLCGEFL